MIFLGLFKSRAFRLQQKYLSSYIFIHINKCGGTSIERALRIPLKDHDTALEKREKIGGRWNKMYKFSVIRDPYDRVESLYRYRIKTNQNAMSDKKIPLDDWIREVWVEKNPAYYDIPKMFKPCHYWLTDQQGNLIVDEVVKLEEIDSHWDMITRKIGVNAPLGRHNQTIKNLSKPPRTMNVESQNIIQEAFEPDFVVFNYDA